MNTCLSSAQLKDKAKGCLGGHYGFLIGAILIESLISYAVSFLSPALTFSASVPRFLIGQAVSFCLSVFTGVFNAGFALIYLKLACGATPVLSDIFYGYSRRFTTSLQLSLVYNALSLLLLAAYIPAFWGLRDGNTTLLLLAIPVAVIMQAVYILLWLPLSQCYYLMLDFPDKSAGEILSLSCRITRGQKRRLFLILCGFIPIMLLGILSVIGFLWTGPYLQMTMALFYLDIMKPAQKN